MNINFENNKEQNIPTPKQFSTLNKNNLLENNLNENVFDNLNFFVENSNSSQQYRKSSLVELNLNNDTLNVNTNDSVNLLESNTQKLEQDKNYLTELLKNIKNKSISVKNCFQHKNNNLENVSEVALSPNETKNNLYNDLFILRRLIFTLFFLTFILLLSSLLF